MFTDTMIVYVEHLNESKRFLEQINAYGKETRLTYKSQSLPFIPATEKWNLKLRHLY